jgi:hypothetical protein
MESSKLSRSEVLAMVGGLLLIVGVFLPWYRSTGPNNLIADTPGPETFSGWDVHTIVRWLLIAAALAPLILAWIIYRGHALSWPRGEMTAVVAIAAIGLIGYLAFIDKPGTVTSLTKLQYGVFVAFGGAVLMLVGAATRASQVERPRKPPGVL